MSDQHIADHLTIFDGEAKQHTNRIFVFRTVQRDTGTFAELVNTRNAIGSVGVVVRPVGT